MAVAKLYIAAALVTLVASRSLQPQPLGGPLSPMQHDASAGVALPNATDDHHEHVLPPSRMISASFVPHSSIHLQSARENATRDMCLSLDAYDLIINAVQLESSSINITKRFSSSLNYHDGPAMVFMLFITGVVGCVMLTIGHDYPRFAMFIVTATLWCAILLTLFVVIGGSESPSAASSPFFACVFPLAVACVLSMAIAFCKPPSSPAPGSHFPPPPRPATLRRGLAHAPYSTPA